MKHWIKTGLYSILAASLLAGCGKQGFLVDSAVVQQKAPGNFIIPPKVDILLAEDDTGSIKEIYGSIAQQLPVFLNNLQNKQWDFHFATTPLTSDRELSQVVASRYDSNWGSLWIPPFPGSLPDAIGTVDPSVFTLPDQYSGFLQYDSTSNSANGHEWGLNNISSMLWNRTTGTGFLRDDALLVVLVIGNGEDTSGVNYCPRSGDGYLVPCEQAGRPLCTDISEAGDPTAQCGSKALTYNFYKNELQALKRDPKKIQMHSAVSLYGGSCLGKSTSKIGSRYIQMAKDTGGKAYDLCSQSVSNILSTLGSNLQNTRLLMKTRYLFIEQEPEMSSIKVVKYAGGNSSQGVEIPQDPNNGWTYAGYLQNVYAIDDPMELNLSSGYAIELHGTAKLVGDDTAAVNYLSKGSRNSAQ
jgi:hypothetical protein